MGWGVWRGGGAERERELSDRHCRPYAAGKRQESLSTFPVRKKGYAAAPVNKERRCSFCTQTLQDVLDRSHA